MTTVLYARLNANGDLHRARGEQSEPGAQVERSLIWCLVRQDQLLGSWVTASVLPVLLVWKIFTSHWMLHSIMRKVSLRAMPTDRQKSPQTPLVRDRGELYIFCCA